MVIGGVLALVAALAFAPGDGWSAERRPVGLAAAAAVGEPAALLPVEPGVDVPTSEAAIAADIEKTLRDLNDHLEATGKRIKVRPPSGARAAPLPARLDLPVGKAVPIDLPSEAREVVVGESIIADVIVSSRRRLFVLGRKVGQTNVFVLDGKGDLITRAEIAVIVDSAPIQAAIARALPEEKLEVRADGDSVILTGAVRSDAIAGRAAAIARRFVDADEKIVNTIVVTREQQVLLQVRVTEVQKNLLKEIGASGQFGKAIPILGKTLPGLGGKINAQGISDGEKLAGAMSFLPFGDLLFSLQFLEQRGLVRSLAEPNLVAVSGETASMLSGGEIPITIPTTTGLNVQYKPFGVSLAFLPIVLDSGRISLKMSTEVSKLTNETVEIPANTTSGKVGVHAFSVRRAATTVEIASGGSLMIAGLLQNDLNSSLTGIPGLMDLPILGQLFRSDAFKRNETELVVIVTASLIKPVAPTNMVAPVDAVSPGGDMDAWLFAKLLGYYSPGFVQDYTGEAKPLNLFGFSVDEFMP